MSQSIDPSIEYFYSAFSAYAYLGSARFMAIARAAHRRIHHRPMDWHGVVAANGPGPTNGRTSKRRAYFSGREIERWAQVRNAPVMNGFPTGHDHDMTLANCLLIATQQARLDVDLLAHRLLEGHWRYDADLADERTLAQIAKKAGIDSVPLLKAAASDAIEAQYRANTKEAIERSVFGSPTYFVDGDMFYGQDRLELIERALTQPFAGCWPRIGRGAQLTSR